MGNMGPENEGKVGEEMGALATRGVHRKTVQEDCSRRVGYIPGNTTTLFKMDAKASSGGHAGDEGNTVQVGAGKLEDKKGVRGFTCLEAGIEESQVEHGTRLRLHDGMVEWKEGLDGGQGTMKRTMADRPDEECLIVRAHIEFPLCRSGEGMRNGNTGPGKRGRILRLPKKRILTDSAIEMGLDGEQYKRGNGEERKRSKRPKEKSLVLYVGTKGMSEEVIKGKILSNGDWERRKKERRMRNWLEWWNGLNNIHRKGRTKGKTGNRRGGVSQDIDKRWKRRLYGMEILFNRTSILFSGVIPKWRMRDNYSKWIITNSLFGWKEEYMDREVGVEQLTIIGEHIWRTDRNGRCYRVPLSFPKMNYIQKTFVVNSRVDGEPGLDLHFDMSGIPYYH